MEIEEQRRLKENCTHINLGCCKLPRYQYSNYGQCIVRAVDSVHQTIKKFVQLNNCGMLLSSDTDDHHRRLFEKLKNTKGIGPLSYNQLWHCLCLSGMLPFSYMQSSAICPNSGPGKLIQTYYPKCKSEKALLAKLNEVRGNIRNLGMERITNFLLENGMCELYRLGVRTKLATQSMDVEQRKQGYASHDFHNFMIHSSPTKNPDIYVCNPFTDEWEHLFRVGEKCLEMRPSFLDNSDTSSSLLRCDITYDRSNENIVVTIKGPYLKKENIEPSSLFIS